MQVRLLGPFQLEDAGRQVTVSGVRQRAVLADLVLNANEVVPSERLLLDLWGEDSPPAAANALQAVPRHRIWTGSSALFTTGEGRLNRQLRPAVSGLSALDVHCRIMQDERGRT
jgi:DNA-binding SARP family transcriptional activator